MMCKSFGAAAVCWARLKLLDAYRANGVIAAAAAAAQHQVLFSSSEPVKWGKKLENIFFCRLRQAIFLLLYTRVCYSCSCSSSVCVCLSFSYWPCHCPPPRLVNISKKMYSRRLSAGRAAPSLVSHIFLLTLY